MDRRFVSKFKNINYKPSKMTVLALCIGLRLTIEEALPIKKCWLFLFWKYYFEFNITLFLEKKIYDIEEINIALYDNGCNILGSIPRE
jgi:hypothetical protein